MFYLNYLLAVIVINLFESLAHKIEEQGRRSNFQKLNFLLSFLKMIL